MKQHFKNCLHKNSLTKVSTEYEGAFLYIQHLKLLSIHIFLKSLLEGMFYTHTHTHTQEYTSKKEDMKWGGQDGRVEKSWTHPYCHGYTKITAPYREAMYENSPKTSRKAIPQLHT